MALNLNTNALPINAKQSSKNNSQSLQRPCGKKTKDFFPEHSHQCGYLQLTCVCCQKKFWRRAGQERDRLRRKLAGPFCSRSCQSKSRTNKSGGNYKLTPELVAKMRACDRKGVPIKLMMETFQVSRSCVYDIVRYRKWKDVADLDGIRRSSRPVI